MRLIVAVVLLLILMAVLPGSLGLYLGVLAALSSLLVTYRLEVIRRKRGDE